MRDLLILCLISSTFLFSSTVFGQSPMAKSLVEAMKTGTADSLQSYLDETIILSVMEDESPVSKADAYTKMSTFFTDYPVKSFQYKHEGTSKEGNTFVIGTYLSEIQDAFRTYIVIRDDKVVELCIEED